MNVEANLQPQLLGAGRSHLSPTRARGAATGPEHVTASGKAAQAPQAPAPERLALRRAMRAVVAAALRCLLRLRVGGAGALPARGPALVVCNHVSYLDALVLAAVCPYPLRFVYWHRLARVPLLGALLRLVGGIAVAAEAEDPGLYHGALEAIDAALAAGEVVAIFPEGRLTKDGEVGPFRRGVERVLSRRPVPVVPAALRGLYGGLFSRAPKKRLPGPRPRVEVVVAPALAPGGLCASSLRARVCALRGDVR